MVPAEQRSHVSELLGRRYADLQFAPVLRGVLVPDREKIVDQSYVSFPDLGISLVLPDDEVVSAVHLYSDQHDGFSGYAGELPNGLSFGMTKDEVRATFGDPDQSGPARDIHPFGMSPAWDSFVSDGRRIHVEYQLEGSGIRLVTISAP
jgi:hypothetical protein